MEKKYYELIVSLIRNHRKFAGYESILDDIVEDVYNHELLIMNIIADLIEQIDDEKYISLLENHLKKHESLNKKILRLLEEEC